MQEIQKSVSRISLLVKQSAQCWGIMPLILMNEPKNHQTNTLTVSKYRQTMLNESVQLLVEPRYTRLVLTQYLIVSKKIKSSLKLDHSKRRKYLIAPSSGGCHAFVFPQSIPCIKCTGICYQISGTFRKLFPRFTCSLSPIWR